MQIITDTYLKKIRKIWQENTMEEDPAATLGNAYFNKLATLVETFDVVQIDEPSDVSGDFSIDSNMAMITDGAVKYSMNGIDPVKNEECAIAHVTGANYVITIDEITNTRNCGVTTSYTQLFVKDNDAWISENADLIIGRFQNLEAEWAKGD